MTLSLVPTITGLAAFWLVSYASGVQGRRESWLFEAEDAEPFWRVWTSQDLDNVRWSLLAPRPSVFLSLGLVLVMSLTLRVAGIEGSTGATLDVDEEVRCVGVANALAAACGGVIGSHSPGLTTFNMEVGSEDFRPSVLTAVLTLAVWLCGAPIMNYIPRFLLAGILMNLGLLMTQEWMWTACSKVGYGGLLIVYTQALSSLCCGLLPSILLGLVVACVVAKVQLQGQNVLKYHLSGRSLRSHRRRPEEETRILASVSRIEALGLEGSLAEANTFWFAAYVKRYVNRNSIVRFIVLDLRCCQEVSCSACALLAKLDSHLRDRGVTVLYANLEPVVALRLSTFSVAGAQNHSFDTLPDALEYCEDRVLSARLPAAAPAGRPAAAAPRPSDEELLAALARLVGGGREGCAPLAAAGTWRAHAAGEILAQQGSTANILHFCLPGHCEISEVADVGQSSFSQPLQLSLDALGFICGVEGVLLDECSRSTCTVASDSGWTLSVSKQALERLLAEDLVAGLRLSQRISQAVAKQLLRRGDQLGLVVDVTKGGGWHGSHFDEQTAGVSASLLDGESRLGSPTLARRRFLRQDAGPVPGGYLRPFMRRWPLSLIGASRCPASKQASTWQSRRANGNRGRQAQQRPER
ncbi:unnamed protein product [Prorocentrum cordatum]|uniref:STAS domain-containing protein n=1 Tax=Prorocentrum cordatum TaxID=2364126 RepID=A0ABN9TWF4_9DINO|nr:unnamed protein product [Polarella glacialis]